MITSVHEAQSLLRKIGASQRLLTHLNLVTETAIRLLEIYNKIGMPCNALHIQLGASIHDAGKILFPAELDGPGSRHEAAGEELLLAHGVQADVARCCVSHAAWQGPTVSFEERSVALADKLWKGKREESLELLIIDEVAARLGRDRWQVYTELDSAFEEVAAGASERLQRSL